MGTLRKGVALACIAIATGLAMISGSYPTAIPNDPATGYNKRRRRSKEYCRNTDKKQIRETNRNKNKAARKARKRSR